MSSIPSNEELRAQASTSSSVIKVAGVLWFAAFMIVMIASIAFLVAAVRARLDADNQPRGPGMTSRRRRTGAG